MDLSDKQAYRELAEKVESGEYFQEAREWYLGKYIYRFVERTYMLMLMFGLILLMLFCYTYYKAIQPIKKSLPVQVEISSAADFSTRITYLGSQNRDFDVNLVYIRYLSGRFIEAIESYDHKKDFKRLRINRNMIETLASPEILGYYTDKISIRNPDSLIMRYRRNTERQIEVDTKKLDIAPLNEEVGFRDNFGKQPESSIKKYQVTANFTATEIERTGTRKTSEWQSKIILSFQTIEYNFEKGDFTPLNFKVLSYESKLVK